MNIIKVSYIKILDVLNHFITISSLKTYEDSNLRTNIVTWQ
jgi:hypothetical protein